MVFASLGIPQNILLCSAAPVIFWQRSLFPSHYVFLLKFPFKEWFIQQGKGMTQLPPQFPSFCKSNTHLNQSFHFRHFSSHSLNCFLFLIPVVLAVSTELFAVPIGFLKTSFDHKSNGIISAWIFFPLGILFFFTADDGCYLHQSCSVDKA